MTAQGIGREAEIHARDLLVKAGLQFIEQNFRCRGGEIDLLMQDGPTLVFVEVRYRRSNRHGGALASVDLRKRQRLLHAANVYLSYKAWSGPCRFDVVGFEHSLQRYRWVRDAFSA